MLRSRISSIRILAFFIAIAAAPYARAALTPAIAPLGWTKDGLFFAYTEGYEEPETWFVVSARSAKTEVIQKKDVFDAWAAKHPLDEIDRCETRSSEGKGGSVAACRSPDSRRIAFLHNEERCKSTGGGDFDCEQKHEVRIDRTEGPRVQLMGKGLSDEAFDRAAAALERAGFFPTGVEVATAARERTIVYMRSPDGEVAKRMSAAIPGGADRAKLDWSSKFDAIVALGASADKSREADRPSPEEGVVTCVLKKPLEVDEDGEAEYRCAGTGAAFSLWCDPSADAEHTGPSGPKIERARWTKTGGKEGIEFEGGFVHCKRASSRK